MTVYSINNQFPHAKRADAKEWSLCQFLGVSRAKHDAVRYDRASDISAQDMEISVKSSAFTLMAGSLCEGLEDFDAIWNLYAERVHSNTFAYITQDFVVYMMNLNEFKAFVYEFCHIERESAKNGGAAKIRSAKESKKMLNWLASRV